VSEREVLMPKSIVVMSDGTGNELKVSGNTNVVRIHGLLDRSDPRSLVTFYDPGVGTMGSQGATTAIGRRWSKLTGLAFGKGLKANVVQGYEFIMNHYEPGDKIFLFGFSRGAYTVRAIAGLINHVGLLPPGSENLVPYAMKFYWHSMVKRGKPNKPISDKEWNLAGLFSKNFARPDFTRKKTGAIAYLGVWDTVNATGSLRKRVVLPYTARLEVVDKARHAVAIDEKRKNFKPALFKFDTSTFHRRQDGELKEVWFAGVHSYVGGDHQLSDITLQWIATGAVEQGLELTSDFESYEELPTSRALGDLGKNKGLWRLLGFEDRTILPTNAIVHESVIIRRDRAGYSPSQLPADPPVDPWPHSDDPE
jgi:uncharacterized protein (DUF2235 family)